jgi:uncharacterized protein
MRRVEDCNGVLHPKAVEGIELFNAKDFFEAHEELETAWKEETNDIRDLYRGILQVAVTYLHITRGNYDGAVKVYARSLKWTQGWSDVCRGINVKKFRSDAEAVMREVERLGKDGIGNFDVSLFNRSNGMKNACGSATAAGRKCMRRIARYPAPIAGIGSIARI